MQLTEKLPLLSYKALLPYISPLKSITLIGQNKYSELNLYFHEYTISAKYAQSLCEPSSIDLLGTSTKNTPNRLKKAPAYTHFFSVFFHSHQVTDLDQGSECHVACLPSKQSSQHLIF